MTAKPANRETLLATTVESYVKNGGKTTGGALIAEIYDVDTKGLQLRVRRKGVASWSYRYRFTGEMRRHTIGRAGPDGMSLADARAAVRAFRVKLDAGIDPVAEVRAAEAAACAAAEAAEDAKRADEARITVAAAAERYVAASTAASAKNRKEPPRERIRTLRLDVVPALGRKFMADLTDDDIMRLVEAAVANGHKRKPSKIYDECRAFLNWARKSRLIAKSPLVSERPDQPKPRDRFLTPQEVRAFTASLDQCPMTDPFRDILRLIMRLGQRVNEVAGMLRREINLADDVWVIGSSRAKNNETHRVPLPPQARMIIVHAMQRGDSKWVFPNKAGDGPSDVVAVAKALLRSQPIFGFLNDEDEPNSFTTHDLRRTCATYLEKLGTPEKTVAAVLNHKWVKAKTVTSIYARDDHFDAAWDALVKWEIAIDQIEAGRDPFNVSVADRRKRAEAIRQAMTAPISPSADEVPTPRLVISR